MARLLQPRGCQQASRSVGIVDLPVSWWSQALIGVTGAEGGSVISALRNNTATVVGVLTGNVHTSDSTEIEEILQGGVSVARESIAVYVPDWTLDTKITVARR